MLKWHVAGVNSQISKRADNRHSFYVSPDSRVFAVARRLRENGALADKLAVDAVDRLWRERKLPASDAGQIQEWLATAVSRANSTVFEAAAKDSATVIGAVITVAVQSEDGCIYIAHVGDSCAYRVRAGQVDVLTHSHRLSEIAVRQGTISQELLNSRKVTVCYNVLARLVGGDETVEIDKIQAEVLPDDCIIFCSSWIPSVLNNERLRVIAQRNDQPADICQSLFDELAEAGDSGNVSAIAIKYYSGA